MSYTNMSVGHIDLEVEYFYDPGKPDSGAYAPEYPTLEIARVKLLVYENDSCDLLRLIKNLMALDNFKVILLKQLEKSGELR